MSNATHTHRDTRTHTAAAMHMQTGKENYFLVALSLEMECYV